MNRTLMLFFLLLGVCSAQLVSPETEVRQALSQFLQVFDNLEWDRFTAFFADDATMFQPRKFVRRADGKSEIKYEFQQVFEDIRGTQTKPALYGLAASRSSHTDARRRCGHRDFSS
jgi:ketosteroid isomerase-like protein